MREAKVEDLGLGLLIRLSPDFKYPSLLGGETQRPCPNIQSGALPAQDCVCPLHLDSKHDETTGVHSTLRRRPYPAHKAVRPTEMNPPKKYRIENFDEILK